MLIQRLLITTVIALVAGDPAFASDKEREKSYAMGQQWANGGISARCLIEVTPEADQHHLKTEIGREAVAYRAQLFAGLYRDQVRIADELYPLVQKQKAYQRDLLDNGLITQAEYDATAGASEKSYVLLVEDIAGYMAEAPACEFFRLHNNSPSVQRAKARLAAQ